MSLQIIEAQAALNEMHSSHFQKPDVAKPQAKPDFPQQSPLEDDAALIEKARKAKNGAKFKALFSGDCSAYLKGDGGIDRSSAAAALCTILAYWCGGDAGRMDRIFRQSSLYAMLADKWDTKHQSDGATWGQMAIDFGIQSTTKFYQPKGKSPATPSESQNPPAGGSTMPPAERPVIRLAGGELPRVVYKIESALLAAGSSIYRRGAELVRPLIIEKPKFNNGFTCPVDSVILEPITEGWLMHEATSTATFEKFDKRAEAWLRVDCPPRAAATLLNLSGSWRFPMLDGVIEAPTLRPDGSLLNVRGYDKATALYLHLPNDLKVKIREKPTKPHAFKAYQFLLDLLVGFPFVGMEDVSVAVANILTALVRRQLRTAPGFLYSAPTPGSGKTLLADVVALIATGKPAPIMSQGQNDEETEKRLGAFLLQGLGMLNLDNLERPLGGELLCSLLTSPEVTIRILGESRSPCARTNFTLMATGNNASVKGDLARRVLLCQLNPNCESPEKRSFQQNLYEHIPNHRGDIIAAGLTILKAYLSAGSPSQGLEPFGGFEQWSDWVRSALVWVGASDPCLSRTRLESSNHETASLGAVLSLWHRECGATEYTVREIIDCCDSANHVDLRGALLDVAAKKNDANVLDPRRLAHWLRKSEMRIIGGYRFEKIGLIREKPQWKVVQV